MNVQYLLDWGILQAQNGNLDSAITSFDQVIWLDPKRPEAFINRGVAYFRQGNLIQARRDLDQAIQLNPSSASAYCNRGMIQTDLGNQQEAILDFKQAIQISPTLAQAYYCLADALVRTMNSPNSEILTEAVNLLQKVIELNPAYWDAYLNLGSVFQKLGDYQQAIQTYQKLINIESHHLEALFQIGSTQWKDNQLEAARKSLTDILQLKPDHEQAQFILAMVSETTLPPKAPESWIARMFDDCAHSFDNHLIVQLNYQTPEKIHQEVMTIVGQDYQFGRVLDLGCGTGLCGRLFSSFSSYLVGVDLSPKMIHEASSRGIYNKLEISDILKFLAIETESYELILAADVFVYIGDLYPIFVEVRNHLSPSGLFAFSVEAGEEGYQLDKVTGRFTHGINYLRHLARTTFLTEIHWVETVLRLEAGLPVNGYLCVLGLDPPDSGDVQSSNSLDNKHD